VPGGSVTEAGEKRKRRQRRSHHWQPIAPDHRLTEVRLALQVEADTYRQLGVTPDELLDTERVDVQTLATTTALLDELRRHRLSKRGKPVDPALWCTVANAYRRSSEVIRALMASLKGGMAGRCRASCVGGRTSRHGHRGY
jgi:hypothetical protein